MWEGGHARTQKPRSMIKRTICSYCKEAYGFSKINQHVNMNHRQNTASDEEDSDMRDLSYFQYPLPAVMAICNICKQAIDSFEIDEHHKENHSKFKRSVYAEGSGGNFTDKSVDKEGKKIVTCNICKETILATETYQHLVDKHIPGTGVDYDVSDKPTDRPSYTRRPGMPKNYSPIMKKCRICNIEVPACVMDLHLKFNHVPEDSLHQLEMDDLITKRTVDEWNHKILSICSTCKQGINPTDIDKHQIESHRGDVAYARVKYRCVNTVYESINYIERVPCKICKELHFVTRMHQHMFDKHMPSGTARPKVNKRKASEPRPAPKASPNIAGKVLSICHICNQAIIAYNMYHHLVLNHEPSTGYNMMRLRYLADLRRILDINDEVPMTCNICNQAIVASRMHQHLVFYHGPGTGRRPVPVPAQPSATNGMPRQLQAIEFRPSNPGPSAPKRAREDLLLTICDICEKAIEVSNMHKHMILNHTPGTGIAYAMPSTSRGAIVQAAVSRATKRTPSDQLALTEGPCNKEKKTE